MLEFARIIKYYQPYCGTVYQKFKKKKKGQKKEKPKKKVDRVDEECDSDWQVEQRESCEAGAVKRTRARALSYLE